MKTIKKIMFALLCFIPIFTEAKIYNVKDYGAKGYGKNIDSHSINSAIENATTNGGGTIYFPSGEYTCYSIHLASHINLYLEQGAK